jgi:hypothetical protein
MLITYCVFVPVGVVVGEKVCMMIIDGWEIRETVLRMQLQKEPKKTQ